MNSHEMFGDGKSLGYTVKNICLSIWSEPDLQQKFDYGYMTNPT